MAETQSQKLGGGLLTQSLAAIRGDIRRMDAAAPVDDDGLKAVASAIKIAKGELNATPAVMFVGNEGFGKTTSIGRLFGGQVGKISSTGRGTTEAAEYPWLVDNAHCRLIDLPGLGGDPRHVEQLKEIYRARLKDSDAVVVVVCPPRPLLYGTLETVEFILGCNFPAAAITFGYNKLRELEVEGTEDDEVRNVKVDPVHGPTHPAHVKLVREAKDVFYKGLTQRFPEAGFSERQIVEYDAKNGWNIIRLMEQTMTTIPWQALRQWREATKAAEQQVAALAVENEAYRQDYERYKGQLEDRFLMGLEQFCRDNQLLSLAESIGLVRRDVAKALYGLRSNVVAIATGAGTFLRSVWNSIW